jgi:hypothetical protein
MEKIIIQSLISGNFLIIDEGYGWTNDCREATGFDSDEEAVNTIHRIGFINTVVRTCNVDLGQNSG